MVNRLRIARLDAKQYQPLAAGGPPDAALHRRLDALIRRHLPGSTASLLAEPVPTADGRFVEWYSDLSGQPIPLASLSAADRAAADVVLADRLRSLAALADRLDRSGTPAARQSSGRRCGRPSPIRARRRSMSSTASRCSSSGATSRCMPPSGSRPPSRRPQRRRRGHRRRPGTGRRSGRRGRGRLPRWLAPLAGVAGTGRDRGRALRAGPRSLAAVGSRLCGAAEGCGRRGASAAPADRRADGRTEGKLAYCGLSASSGRPRPRRDALPDARRRRRRPCRRPRAVSAARRPCRGGGEGLRARSTARPDRARSRQCIDGAARRRRRRRAKPRKSGGRRKPRGARRRRRGGRPEKAQRKAEAAARAARETPPAPTPPKPRTAGQPPEQQAAAPPPKPTTPSGLPPCPGERTPEEAPDAAIVLDASGSMRLPASASLSRDPGHAEPARPARRPRCAHLRPGGAAADPRGWRRQSAASTASSAACRRCGCRPGDPAAVSEATNEGFFSGAERGRLYARVDALTPMQGTPLAQGILQAGEMVDGVKAPAVMVVISDGDDSCGGNPCAAAERLKAEKAAPENQRRRHPRQRRRLVRRHRHRRSGAQTGRWPCLRKDDKRSGSGRNQAGALPLKPRPARYREHRKVNGGGAASLGKLDRISSARRRRQAGLQRCEPAARRRPPALRRGSGGSVRHSEAPRPGRRHRLVRAGAGAGRSLVGGDR